MILVVFHTAGINEKKKGKKKKFWYRTWMGYCPTELKAGLGAGQGTERVGWARGTQARRRRHGRTGAGRAGSGRAGAGRAGARALGPWARGARPASGRWVGALHGRTAGGHALQAGGTGAL